MPAWRKILLTNNDQSLITATALDFSVFDELTAKFEAIYTQYSLVPVEGKYVKLKHTNRGRPRLINREVCLGLVLVWSRTRESFSFLQLIFGLSRTGIEVYLRFGKKLLIKLLFVDINSKIGMLSRSRVEACKDAFEDRLPLLEDVILSMDDLRLCADAPDNFVEQNNYYNG